ncbi:MAG: hypothetical protein H6Q61_792 [Firmicutes bacterium]|nr:hypothetical protein [Bacillota bacterium]
MASTNKTAQYSLNLWEPEDQVLREDFNGDNRKIEAALLSLRPVTGYYTGTSSDASTGKEISLGFTPSAVVVTSKLQVSSGNANAAISIATPAAPGATLWTTVNGFYADKILNYNNVPHNPFRYIAWR